MTTGLPDIPDDLKRLQVDPNHAASVLVSILGAATAPDINTSTGLPSPQAQQMTPLSTDPAVANIATQAASPTQVPDGTFVHPGSEDVMGVNSPYGPRGDRGFHPGVDLAFPDHTSVLAATSGQVTQAGGVAAGSYGVVEITAPNGIVTRYGHVSALKVASGDTVQAGQVIAVSGGAEGEVGAGNATGPHLHFEVLVDGKNVDPTPFLAGGVSIAGSPETTTNDAGVTTAKPLSPEQIISAQLTNIADVIAGKQPNKQATRPETAAAPGTTDLGTPNTPGTPGNASGNWATDILEGIGAPVTDENIRLMNAWMAAEGGAVHNNPLNTTQGAEGATNWNDIGVKTYVSYEQGLAATIQTILNGRYGDIIAALRAGNDATATARAIADSPWGTGEGALRILGAG